MTTVAADTTHSDEHEAKGKGTLGLGFVFYVEEVSLALFLSPLTRATTT